MNRIKVGIIGYGNIAKGVELALGNNPDMDAVAVFTRRDPKTVSTLTGIDVVNVKDILNYKSKIDVMIICGGSATDLPVMGPEYARNFNTIDSFDTHARIPEYFDSVDKAAKEGKNTSIISVGWDPGMFSLSRVYASSILPGCKTYTFWGKGVSQGHSDAIRRVDGVKKGIQYTIPVESAINEVRSGAQPELTARQKHTRLCYIVAKEGADLQNIEKTIKNMPNYFSDYDTTVNFISEEDFDRDHSKMPHGGFVISSGHTGNNDEHKHIIEYSLKLDSNPEFTGSILVSYARAAYRMSKDGQYGCKTVLDVAPSLLSPKTGEDLRKEML